MIGKICVSWSNKVKCQRLSCLALIRSIIGLNAFIFIDAYGATTTSEKQNLLRMRKHCVRY